MLIGKLRRRQAVRYAVVNALVMERRLQNLRDDLEHLHDKALRKIRELSANSHNHDNEKRGMMVPE